MDKKINKLSKSLSLLLALVMVLGVSIPAFASSELVDTKDSIVESVESARASLQKTMKKAYEIKRVYPSVDGQDVDLSEEWVEIEIADKFRDAVNKGYTTLNDKDASVEDLNTANKNVEEAMTAYESAKKPGLVDYLEESKEELAGLIELANSKLDINVSEDGSDVWDTDKWVTQKELDDFKAEIKKAEEFLAKEDIDFDGTYEFYEVFLEIYDAFKASLKSGSLEGSEIDRISGSNIYETSVKLANAMFPEGAKKVVVATANNKN